MEALIVIVIIVVVIIILGVSLAVVAKGLLIMAAVVLALMLLFFVAMTVAAIVAKPAVGEFDGLEKNEDSMFETAYYRVGDERIQNLFPAESIMQSRIYSKGEKKLRVLRTKKRVSAIDRHSLLIIIVGLFSTLPSLLLVLNMLDFINGIAVMLN